MQITYSTKLLEVVVFEYIKRSYLHASNVWKLQEVLKTNYPMEYPTANKVM